tara:strand:+ start:1421 stop:1963 length:543 start_codon:yes stop_codon:yes gene_type:complete
MTIQEFKTECKRTCPSLGSSKLDLSHMVMGMLTELQELDEALVIKDYTNIGEEIADYYWYMVNYATFRDIDISFITSLTNKYGLDSRTLVFGLYDITAKLTDAVKKHVAYNRVIDKYEEASLLNSLNIYLQGMIRKQGISFTHILQSNIDKLKVRFPEEFSDDLANNRDLTEERKTLKNN